jgi:HEAT repeat protein
MVFGLFSKEKALQRAIERATNKLAQQADRWAAMEQLQKDGSEDALYGLCKRFGVTSMKQVEDEQEKNWVVDVLVGFGAAALPAITRYVKSGPQLSFALKAVERIGTPAQVLAVVDRILADEEPGYTRDPERRLDVIRWLGELERIPAGERVGRIAPYLKDFDQNVRCAAADALSPHDAALIGDALLAAFLRPEEESGRFRRQIAEILAEKKIPLAGKGAEVAPLLTGPVAGFAVSGDRLVAR